MTRLLSALMVIILLILSCDSQRKNAIDSILELSNQAILRQEKTAGYQYSMLSANYVESPDRLKIQWNTAFKVINLMDKCVNKNI